jgi:hypothetical protein
MLHRGRATLHGAPAMLHGRRLVRSPDSAILTAEAHC